MFIYRFRILTIFLFVFPSIIFAQEVQNENEEQKVIKEKSPFQEKFSFICAVAPGISYSYILNKKLSNELDTKIPDHKLTKRIRGRYNIESQFSFYPNISFGYRLSDKIELQASYCSYETFRTDVFNDLKLNFSLGLDLVFYQNEIFEIFGLYLRHIRNRMYPNLKMFPVLRLGIGYRMLSGFIFALKTNLSLDVFSIVNNYSDCLQKVKYRKKPEKDKVLSLSSSLSLPILEFSIGYDICVLLRKWF